MLDEIVRAGPALELVLGQEVVVTPSRSPARGARVVAEPQLQSGHLLQQPLINVPLPTPEGPVITNSRP